MISLLGSTLLAPLMAGYFLNGGVGQLMQPVPASSGGPPPSYTAIATGSGAILATGNGTYIITH